MPSKTEALTLAQVRAGRAMLDWSMSDLARAARLSVSTVKRFEDGGTQAVSESARGSIRDALETEGVRFLPDDGEGPGVRMRVRLGGTSEADG